MVINKKDGTRQIYAIKDIADIRFDLKITGIEDLRKWNEVLTSFARLKCYPNPSNSEVTIEYNLPNNGSVELYIYDNSGKLVFKAIPENQINGLNKFVWHGKDIRNNTLPNGIYHCSVLFENQRINEKIIILK
jgi:hypothetical protein